MPYARPQLPALVVAAQSDLESRIDGADARLRRNNLNASAAVWAGGLDGVYGAIAFLVRMAFPQTSKGPYLRMHAARQNVFQKLPQAASGSGAAVGTVNGQDIPAGTTLQRGDGAMFITTADATIAGLAATLSIAASVAGSAGNTEAGTVLTITPPIGTVSSSVTVGAGGLIDGTDLETDSELLGRLEQVWQEQPQGGAAWDYVERALQVAGVTRAWVFPNWQGLGTVSVSFVMDDQAGSILPGAGSVAAVLAHLTDLSWKPLGATVGVFAPLAAPCNFTLHLNPDTPALRTAVTAALALLFTTDQTVGGATLPPDADGVTPVAGQIDYDRMWAVITGAVGSGEAGLIAPTVDFVAGNGYLPTLGSVVFE